jgi:hypothetical protein
MPATITWQKMMLHLTLSTGPAIPAASFLHPNLQNEEEGELACPITTMPPKDNETTACAGQMKMNFITTVAPLK